MKDNEKQRKENDLLKIVCDLPRQLVFLHGTENLTEFLLHSLCKEACFNLVKAAYFIDNPDFDHLKGIAGFAFHEAYPKEEHWSSHKEFSSHMKQAPFNQKVRSVIERSQKRDNKNHDSIVRLLAEDLEIETPLYKTWPTKYDNHGLLIFEPREDDRAFIDEHLEKTLYLFGFCPTF